MLTTDTRKQLLLLQLVHELVADKGITLLSETPDGDLLIWKRTDKGLSNIIIHEDGLLAHSFIGTEIADGRFLNFYESPDYVDLKSCVTEFNNH